MRKLEILFLGSLALGGYRDILTPNGVFAIQAFMLIILITSKIFQGQFARTTRPSDLLLPLFFIGYVIIRSVLDSFGEAIRIESIFDTVKPIIIISCLGLSLFRFHLVDDLYNQLQTRHLSHWFTFFGVVSTLYILLLHLVSFKIGRLDNGIYFSTLYVFSNLLVLAALLSNQTLFSMPKDLSMLVVLISRLFVDLRRTPVVIVTVFVITYISLRSLRSLFGRNKVAASPLLQKNLRFFYIIAIAAFTYSFIVNGNFNRLNWEAIQFALYDVRLADILVAIKEVNLRNPIFGLGPIFTLDLKYSSQVHSLPVGIFVSFGWIGLLLFFSLTLRIVLHTISSLKKRHLTGENRFAFLLASVFYLVFFTFSARGFEIESFSVFALSLAIGMKRI